LLTLSFVNWAVAIVCWTISAYLGSTSPTGIFVYTVLFVVGLFAVVVAIGSFVLATFGTEPAPAVAEMGVAGDAADGVAPASGEAPPAEAGAEKPADKPADKPAEKPAEKPADKPAGDSAAKPARPGA
jgi:hypothetical protein